MWEQDLPSKPAIEGLAFEFFPGFIPTTRVNVLPIMKGLELSLVRPKLDYIVALKEDVAGSFLRDLIFTFKLIF